MCYHSKFPEETALEHYATGKKLYIDIRDYVPKYHTSGFEHAKLPIVARGKIQLMEWGLIPPWVRDNEKAKQIQNRTLNAVSETIFEKPAYRGSIMKNRGVCLVDGFFEWREYKGKKYPYYITSEDLVQLGCVFSQWTDKETGEVKDTFSIVTTPANELMAQIHNSKKRMPLVLEDIDRWLDPEATKEEIQGIMKPSGVKLKELPPLEIMK